MNKLSRVLLVSTALAPVLLTYAFQLWLSGAFAPLGPECVAVACGLVLLCILVLKGARQQMERFPFTVRSLRTADTEIVGFVVAYLLPLLAPGAAAFRPGVVVFVLALFFAVVWGTHSYHFNPLLGLLGYHFYDVSDEASVSYVLITRRSLRSAGRELTVIQLTDYMVLDVGSDTPAANE